MIPDFSDKIMRKCKGMWRKIASEAILL